MPTEVDPFEVKQRPSSARPLQGMTVLVVEDSRFACEAMRLMCLKSGARIRRADCLAAAHRHLRVYRPAVAIVDMGLPDGNGAELIAELAAANPRVGVILATSGDAALEDAAMAAGADGFMEKPFLSLAAFQQMILSCLPEDARPVGPRVIPEDLVDPDLLAFNDDLAHVAQLLEPHRGAGADLGYVAQFLSGVALTAGDQTLRAAARRLAEHTAQGRNTALDIHRISGLVQDRLAARRVV